MKLAEATSVSAEALSAISVRHGIRFERAKLVEQGGIINTVYFLDDDFVLRVPRSHPAHSGQARREAIAIPAAVAAGVRTPRLLAFDDARDILPVPYLIVERVKGVNFESLGIEPISVPEVWRELERDLARLHMRTDPTVLDGLPHNKDFDFGDPRTLAEERARDGWISPIEAQWLERWLERLAPLATPHTAMRLVHADVQMSNFMVEAKSRRFQALIDWGCARKGEAATFDFLAMPLSAVPLMLAGHREVASLDDDESAEARIVWCRLQMLLSGMPGNTGLDLAWGERPIAWLFDLMRFFLDPPNERWRAIAPAT